jgi:hypothetical protein
MIAIMSYYNFFIDDNMMFLKELVQKRYKSLWDHFYLKKLKLLHESYDAKFTLNLFFMDSTGEFSLSDFPNSYFDEWQACSSWLKLSFHAYAEKPAYPYAKNGERYNRLAEDYRLIKKEVLRFAPESSFIAPVIIHFFDCDSPTDLAFLKAQGMKVFSVRQPKNRDLEYSPDREVAITGVELFCNRLTVAEIRQKLSQSFTEQKKYINIGTHEQYFYPDYARYLPDHFDRIEAALNILYVNDYQSLFFNEFLTSNFTVSSTSVDL